MGLLDKEEFDPQKRHYMLDLDGNNVVCEHCHKVLEERDSYPGEMDMILGQYRYIRQNLPCQPLNIKQNPDGTISPIDPLKPSSYNTDTNVITAASTSPNTDIAAGKNAPDAPEPLAQGEQE